MASLYKKPVFGTDKKSGKKTRRLSEKWWGRFRDEQGKDRRVPLSADRAVAQQMLNELVDQAGQRAAGVLAPLELQQQRHISEHLDDYLASLRNRGATAGYRKSVAQRIQTVLAECRIAHIDEITANAVLAFLAKLRESGRSIQSSNHYLRAIKSFTRWLARNQRAQTDVLVHLSRQNRELDRRRVRRAFSMAEFEVLVAAAEAGPPILQVSGPERAMVYTIAVYTGLRRNEIASLTKESFDFAADPPTLTVEATYSKHRKRDVVPLRRDLAALIHHWIEFHSPRMPGMALFHIAGKDTAEMIRRDLRAARRLWPWNSQPEESSFLHEVDEQGHVVDFHAVRTTFITNLVRTGISPKMAQLLARHSDINLTMNTYTKLDLSEQYEAVERLPPIPGAGAPDVGAGTVDRRDHV